MQIAVGKATMDPTIQCFVSVKRQALPRLMLHRLIPPNLPTSNSNPQHGCLTTTRRASGHDPLNGSASWSSSKLHQPCHVGRSNPCRQRCHFSTGGDPFMHGPYSTARITCSASYDNAAGVIALFLSLCYAGLVSSFRDNASHGWDLPLSAYTDSFAGAVFAEQIVAALSLVFARASILHLLFRLFAPTLWFRYMIYFGLVWAILISIVSIIVVGAMCAPRRGESFDDLAVAERCGHKIPWAVVRGASDVVLDFFIIYLPIPMLWKLNMGL